MALLKRASVGTGTHWEALAGYARAVRVGERILVSGTTATGPGGVVGAGDPAAQARYIIDTIEAAINQLGGTLRDVVRTRVYVRNIADWEAVARVHGERFGTIRPANTLVQAQLVGEEYLVEIEAEALIGPAMRFSLRLNNDLTLPEYVALAQAAETAGFDQFWVSNDLFLRSAPVILAAVAGATSRIEIGSCILNPYTIHPGEIAMLAATLDELSGNRFNLGLAAGAADFLGWIGLPQTRPLAEMRATITTIRALLRGERGPFARTLLAPWTGDAYLRFAAPRVTPIYLGALSPGMLRLAGELADGALPLLFPPEHYFGVQPYIEQGSAARDTSLGQLDLAACIWVSLDEDRAAARGALAQKVAYYGHALSPLILDRLGLTHADFAPIEHALMAERDEPKALALVDERMLAIGVVGTARDVIARIEPLAQAGARHLSFGPPLGPDPLAAVRLLGREVLPYFRN